LEGHYMRCNPVFLPHRHDFPAVSRAKTLVNPEELTGNKQKDGSATRL
jgi:hypothetical protein